MDEKPDYLRPVGTEFDYFFPRSMSSTDTSGSVVRYRVKSHDRIQGGAWGEGLDVVEVTKIPMVSLILEDAILIETYANGKTWKRGA